MGLEAVAEALAACHGLLLTGGEDVAPGSYGAAGEGFTKATDPARDAFEMALFAATREAGLPVLAICRGFQLVNVALGGTLWQDLPRERPSHLDHDKGESWDVRTHHVRLVAGSRTAQALGIDLMLTNSFHHQAVKDLAPALEATAVADDGLIEGAEGTPDGPWLVGVQWHPESFWQDGEAVDGGLFAAFVEAAREWDQTGSAGRGHPGAPGSGRSLQFPENALG